jgi:hypothetical protein
MVECGANRFRRPSAGAPKLLRQTRNWAGAEKRVLVATKPVDFRKQADGCAGGARRRSVLRGGLRVSLQEDGSHQACLVGWHRHAARKWAVQVAADRGRADESRLLARRAPRRRPSECCSVSTQHIDSGAIDAAHGGRPTPRPKLCPQPRYPSEAAQCQVTNPGVRLEVPCSFRGTA